MSGCVVVAIKEGNLDRTPLFVSVCWEFLFEKFCVCICWSFIKKELGYPSHSTSVVIISC